jgi:O-antigen/teichoic acid export membrane protein
MVDRLPSPLRQVAQRLAANPLLQRVIRNSGYLFSAKTGSAALSFFQSILAARLIGVVQLGLLGAITQFAGLINRLTSFRMGDLVMSYVGEYIASDQDEHAAAVFRTAGLAEVATSILAYLLVVALAPLAERILTPGHDMHGLFALYGLTVLANLMAESSNGLLQIFDRYRLIAVITVGQSLLTLGMIVLAFVTQGGLRAVVMAYLVGKVVWAVAISAAALWEARRQWGPGWWRAPYSLIAPRRREMVRFALSTNITATLTLVTRDSEMLWLNALASPLQAGYYKVALAFMNILLIPVDPLISTTYREVAREVGGRRWQNVRYLLRSGSLLSALWTVPASLGLVVLGPWIIDHTYGATFGPAYASLMVLIVGVAAVNVFYWNRNVLLPMGMPEYPTKVYLVAAVLRIGGILLLVPIYGAIGMAALLSAFFVGTAGVLVVKTLREIQRAEAEPALAPGS